VVAYIIQATVCFFLWWNYRAVLKLRRAYFNTEEYKSSLHSRTLLVSLVPAFREIQLTSAADPRSQTIADRRRTCRTRRTSQTHR
jgi:hypothetical protein